MYNRKKVYEYAQKWAYKRNPDYYNYDLLGGDCTNFVSQCIFSGCSQMNYNRINGWYYIDGNNKSPSWTGVEFLYDFLLSNKKIGPKGYETNIENLQTGDIIQLSFNNIIFTHSLIVIQSGNTVNNTLVAAHTFDAFKKRLSEYEFKKYRCIQINF